MSERRNQSTNNCKREGPYQCELRDEPTAGADAFSVTTYGVNITVPGVDNPATTVIADLHFDGGYIRAQLSKNGHTTLTVDDVRGWALALGATN